MKRTWIAGTALVLAGGMLAACAGKEDGSKQAANEKMPLRIFIDAQNNAMLPPEQDDFVKKTIEEKFNVKLKVEYMAPGEDYNKKINAYLTSNDPPDMWRDSNGDGGSKYALDGLLGDMSKYVTPQAMPNYFKYWVDETTLKRYQVHNQFVRAPVPYSKEIYRAWYIRKDWLDKLGLQVPKTYDDYMKVLRAFTNDDPDGNGKKDTYGFSMSAGGDGIGLDWPEYRKNGLVFASFIENGVFKDTQTDPRVEGVLNDIAKVIGEGVIDPDWFLNKATQHVDKAAQGKVGVVLGSTKDFAFDSNPQSLQSKAKAIFPNANWVPFTPFGDQPLQSGIAPGSPFLFHKTIVEKHPDKVKKITEILDWLASEEGFILTHYGQDGKHYARSGKTITLKPDAIQEDIVKKGDWLSIWDFFTPNTPNTFGLTVVDPRQTDRDRNIIKTLAAIPTAPYIGTSLAPPAGFDLAAFRKRQRELQAKAVFEDKSGKNWPSYREELMTKYNGSKLFDAYAEQIKAAGITK
ncbi:extracellular solute-binding protein [Paenibacillus mesophilus]|uniref:extracellular solute-binding protein n=1 Tax=Paenibacillus mesophilus TaxID=2582849 RepID=UPI00110F43F0|nr:extracellular solute-binding protein [Paenibacillus mesophilus]TMV52990.1 extracellular solute-binding protein [Paenibacillus mesophilus]